MKTRLITLIFTILMLTACSSKEENSTPISSSAPGSKPIGFYTESGYTFGYHLDEHISNTGFKPIVEKNKLYTGNINGQVVALNVSARNQIWITEPARHGEMNDNANGFAANDTTLFVSTAYRVLALNKGNGKLLWEKEIGEWTNAAPLVYKDMVIFGSDDGRVTALNAETGEEVWVSQADEKLGIRSEITEKNGTIYVYGNNGILFAADAKTGKNKWQAITHLSANDWNDPNQQNGEPLQTRPVFFENLVLFGSWDGNVYGVDATNGNIVWETALGKKVSTYPLLLGNTVYATTFDKTFALEAASGKVLWKESNASFMQNWFDTNVVEFRDKLYQGADRMMIVRDRVTGKLLDKWEIPDSAVDVFVSQDTLYIGMFNGDMLAKKLDK